MKKSHVAGIALAGVLAGIQFIRPPSNAGVAEGPQSIVNVRKVPDNVRAILRRSCYDCHSDQTHYPWYSAIQPVAWWLDSHVRDGKSAVNFSRFGAYPPRNAVRKLEAVSNEVHDATMPLPSYLLIHRDARLSPADAAALESWADDLADEIRGG